MGKREDAVFSFEAQETEDRLLGSAAGVLLLLLKFLRGLISIAHTCLNRQTHLWEGKNISTGQIFEIWFVSIFLALSNGTLPAMI